MLTTSRQTTALAGRADFGEGVAIACIALAVLAGTLLTFFDTYRIIAFKTMPFDDYAPYLLWVLGEPGGRVPISPFAYRIGSVIVASLFWSLPPVELNGLVHEPLHLRATQALCLANAASASLAAGILAAYVRARLAVSLEWALILTLVFITFSRFLGLDGVDGIAILPATLLVIAALERRVGLFVCVALIGVTMNEKVILVGAMLVGGRALFVPSGRAANIAMTAGAVAIFGGLILAMKLIAVPGNAHQLDATAFLTSALATLSDTLDPKGLYRNVWPVVLLAGMWAVTLRLAPGRSILARTDILVLVGMVTIAYAMDVGLNVGRAVMYTLPLYLAGAAHALSALRAGAGVATPAPMAAPACFDRLATLRER